MMCIAKLTLVKAALISLFVIWPRQVSAQERFFIIVFGAQSTPIVPNRTHTFATFARVVPCATAGTPPLVEWHTISWVPATLKLRTCAPCPEPGVNLDLNSTIEWCLGTKQRISYWGPYEIDQEMYLRFVAQKARLESGAVSYNVIDSFCVPDDRAVSDCIHAVSDTDYRHSRLYYLEFRRFGELASEFIVFSMAQRRRINPCVRHEWVADLIGLRCQPVIEREYAPLPWWH
jgi:hypothetical protein